MTSFLDVLAFFWLQDLKYYLVPFLNAIVYTLTALFIVMWNSGWVETALY